MNLQEEVVIPLDRATVYAALNDPEILKQSIPGCESLTRISDTDMEAVVVVKFGPVKASFNSEVTLSTEGEPERFSLTGKGDAGIAGFAKGGADVVLTEQDNSEQGKETVLNYEVQIDISGKLAQVGSRLVEGTCKRLAKKFFQNFEAAVVPPA